MKTTKIIKSILALSPCICGSTKVRMCQPIGGRTCFVECAHCGWKGDMLPYSDAVSSWNTMIDVVKNSSTDFEQRRRATWFLVRNGSDDVIDAMFKAARKELFWHLK